MRFIAFLLVLAWLPASAEIWRWTDAEGRVNYSSLPPPKGVRAIVVETASPAPLPGLAPESGPDCHSIRCQGERLEERISRRDAEEGKLAALRAASAPKPVRGLDFRKYVSIQRGMTEGELLVLAGEPDLFSDQGIAIAAPSTVPLSRRRTGPARTGLAMTTWTWLPTSGDPFTTTVTLVGGRVSEIERVRKF